MLSPILLKRNGILCCVGLWSSIFLFRLYITNRPMTRWISVVYCFIDNHDQSMSSASSKDFWEYISRLVWLRTGSKGERGEVAYIIPTNHLSLFFLFFICCFWGFPKLRLISRLSIHCLRNCKETWSISLLFYIQIMQIISGTIVVPRKSWKKMGKTKQICHNHLERNVMRQYQKQNFSY